MGFWKILLAGFALTMIVDIVIGKKVRDTLVATSVAVVGGYVGGFIIAVAIKAPLISPMDQIGTVYKTIMIILGAVLTGAINELLLAIFKTNIKQFRSSEITALVIVSIIALAGWTLHFSKFLNNIEEINETVVAEEQENQLLYFENIPVQQVSGSLSGEVSGHIFGGDGEISGSISTSEEISYWYLNENNEGKYNSVPTDKSKIKFIEDTEKSHVKVITYRNQIRRIDKNKGRKNETTVTESEWNEYIFYLPQAIMQYSLE